MTIKRFGYLSAAAVALLATAFQLTTIATGLTGASTPSLYPLCVYALAGYNPDCAVGEDPATGALVMAAIAGLLVVAARRWSGDDGEYATAKLLVYPFLVATAFLVAAVAAFALLVPLSTVTDLTDPVAMLFEPVVYGGFVVVYVGSFVRYAERRDRPE